MSRRFVFAALAGALAFAAYADRTTYYVAEDGDDEMVLPGFKG